MGAAGAGRRRPVRSRGRAGRRGRSERSRQVQPHPGVRGPAAPDARRRPSWGDDVGPCPSRSAASGSPICRRNGASPGTCPPSRSPPWARRSCPAAEARSPRPKPRWTRSRPVIWRIAAWPRCRAENAPECCWPGPCDDGAQALLVDEPIAGLDPDAQLMVLERLKARARGGQAVLVSLHDLTLAVRFADRVAVLIREGRRRRRPMDALSPDVMARVFGLTARWIDGARRPAAVRLRGQLPGLGRRGRIGLTARRSCTAAGPARARRVSGPATGSAAPSRRSAGRDKSACFP
jgi:hypothetical protein